jgi:hypothetical protein
MKVMLNLKELFACTDPPRQEYMDRILKEAGQTDAYWDVALENRVHVVERMPESNGVFGMKWVKIT